MKKLLALFSLIVLFSCSASAEKSVRVSSKVFTEGYVLAEIISQHLENRGMDVDRNFGLQDRIAYASLLSESTDMYIDYSGTLAKVELKAQAKMTFDEVASAFKEKGVLFFSPFGFSNTYALAMKRSFAEEKGIKKISDLKGKDLRVAFSPGFAERNDGWSSIKNAYGIDFKYEIIDHGLLYKAVSSNAMDLVDVYSTDAKIGKNDMVLLEDDLNVFPAYEAAIVARVDLSPKVVQHLKDLENTIDTDLMMKMNGKVEFDKMTFCKVASDFLFEKGLAKEERDCGGRIDVAEIMQQTWETLYLTFVALFGAILVSIPLGIILYRVDLKWLTQPVLGLSGILQTIPSLALLFFMIPVFQQTGPLPAIVGLFLYSILPILRNTMTALTSVDRKLVEVGVGIGLTRNQVLGQVELPIAAPVILAGVRTAAVISVGTATFAAFIGAGGLGESIVQGLTMNDNMLMLQGVIPASILAITIELMFEFIEKQFFSYSQVKA